MKKIGILLIIIVSNLVDVKAQIHFNFFKPVNFASSFIAETRSDIIKLETGYINKPDKNYYNSGINERPIIESRFGYNFPIFTYRKQNYQIYFGLPGGAVTLTDMFEEKTAPVINTDYWFGTELRFIFYPIVTGKFLKNFAVKLQPVFHESTHLGDEFAIHGYEEIADFQRINISYEAWNLALILNDTDTLKGNVLSFKAGIQNLWNKKEGFYFTDSIEVKGSLIKSSEKSFEYFFTINYERTKGFLASENWKNVLSAEINNRIKLSYDTNIDEARIWSVNSYFGWEYNRFSGHFKNFGFYFRYYQGLNPHGQFRNTSGFNFKGISIVLK